MDWRNFSVSMLLTGSVALMSACERDQGADDQLAIASGSNAEVVAEADKQVEQGVGASSEIKVVDGIKQKTVEGFGGVIAERYQEFERMVA